MAKDPADRYQSMKEMIRDIRAYKNHKLVEAHKYGFLDRIKIWNKRKNNVPLAASGVAMLALIFGGPTIGLLERKARYEAEGRADAEKFVGKNVEWKSPAGKIIKGKIAAAHGNKGVVRAIFEKGLPGQAITTEVEIK